MGNLAPFDVAVLAVIALAFVRGLVRGVIREAFSLAALAAAVIAARTYGDELADALAPRLATWPPGAVLALAMGTLGLGALLAVRIAGRLVRRGAAAVGLGAADRLAGGALGLAEGALVAALLVAGARATLGPDHSAIAGTRSLAALDAAEARLGREAPRKDVAAPPPLH